MPKNDAPFPTAPKERASPSPEYCRRQALHGKIIATPRLTPEEQEYFRRLKDYNNFMTRLANLYKYKDPAFNKEA